VRIDDIPEPEPGPSDAVVRVAACGICGSDLSYIAMGGLAGPGKPMCLGHEIAGTVDSIGTEVTSVRVGDRVVVHPGDDEIGRIGNGGPEGGLTPLLLVTQVDRGRLHAVPDDLSLEVAAFAEPLAVGMHAAEQADVRPDDGVCVFGCGPIGLAAVASLVDRGHDDVVAVDLSPTRLELALGVGARAAIDPTTTDLWDELARLHGTVPFMFGPTPATAAFIEVLASQQAVALAERTRMLAEQVDQTVRARVEAGAAFRTNTPEPILSGLTTGPGSRSYAVTPDGQRFLSLQSVRGGKNLRSVSYTDDWLPRARRLLTPAK